MRTPGALNIMHLYFELSYPIVAQDEVRLVGTAPFGFVFAASCLVSTASATFANCKGQSNIFEIKSATNRIDKGSYQVSLQGNNAPDTPNYNFWRLAAYVDEEPQFVTFSEYAGFSILQMPVSIKGNNQLGKDGALFWTFRASKDANRKATLIIEAPGRPSQSDFKLNCDHVNMIGLPKMPACNVVPSKPSELVLVLSNSTITAGIEYTFSIGVLNPGEQPEKRDNFWALTLKNR